MNTIETWRPVVGFENDYAVSDQGRVKRTSKTKRTDILIMSGTRSSHGYRDYALTKNGVTTRRYGHRLVAAAFIPNPHDLPQVNHMDGDGMNNCVSNLEWVSNTQNLLHSRRILGKEIGENHHGAKLNRADVYKIRRMIAAGHTNPAIAQAIGKVNRRTISWVRTGGTWGHVPRLPVLTELARIEEGKQ
jgi:hypothetical protein